MYFHTRTLNNGMKVLTKLYGMHKKFLVAS